MASSISSLGLGSAGVLSFDIIDKLKAVDQSAMVKPIENKISANATKQSDLSILMTLAATVKSATSTISNENSYLQRNTSVSNSAISVTTQAGSAIQDFTFNVKNLAQSDIYQSKAFTSNSTALGIPEDTLKIELNGTTYAIDITSSMTLDELKTKITDATDGKLNISVLNTGEASTPFRLVIKSKETGASNLINFSQTSGDTLSALGLNNSDNHLQTAKDASFKYNGVTVTRNTNTIDDLIVGVSITLNETQAEDKMTNVSIKQDLKNVKEALTSFISAYNELMNNLDESTKYDTTTKASGTFQNSNQIKSLKSELKAQLLSTDGLGRSLSEYGITLNSAGNIEADDAVLESLLGTKASNVEDFFRGSTNAESGEFKKGFFTNFNDMIFTYVTDKKSILNLFQTSLTAEKNTLTKNKDLAVSRLDSKYEIMATKFTAYDSIINKLNNQFQSLSMMIEASYKNDK